MTARVMNLLSERPASRAMSFYHGIVAVNEMQFDFIAEPLPLRFGLSPALGFWFCLGHSKIGLMKLEMEGNKKDGGGKDRMWNQNDFKTVAYSATGRLSKLILWDIKITCNVLLHLHFRFDCGA